MSAGMFTGAGAFTVEEIVRRAYAEDFASGGDITTEAVVPGDSAITGRIVARQPGVVAGVAAAVCAFRLLDAQIELSIERDDGERVAPGETIMHLSGKARAILSAERTALNLLGHLSGVATTTAELVEAIGDYRARLTCTRKTTPGLRVLEKHAVRLGGGSNHRFGLGDAVLIKDNHIAIAGGIRTALERATAAAGHMRKIEVEVDTLDQLEEALAAGPPDAVLLDNMPPATLARAVELVAGRGTTEASGGITRESIREVAASGVDYISVGWITHSAPALDIGLDLDAR